MDFVWVFPLILAFLSIGPIHTEKTDHSSDKCIKCQAGSHKIGSCSNGTYKCKKCESGTYTEIENAAVECIRCNECRINEVKIQNCSLTSNVKCDCEAGYYYYGEVEVAKYCVKCSGNCMNNTDCKRKCLATTTTSSATSTTSTTSTTSATSTTSKTFTTILTDNETRSSTSKTPSGVVIKKISGNEMLWLWFCVMVLLVAVILFGLVLLFIWKHCEKPNICPWWATNKEHCSHQDSSPTTLTINISEETPMMPLNNSPITPQHPAHNTPLLSNSAQKVAKQDEKSEQWPAIVLYAIIKEVPLRRWKEFLRLLSVDDQQLERVELEAGLGLGSIERQYQMLRLWSQHTTANLNDVFSALHYMDLSGCAQLLQESLEKLHWRPDQKQGFTACRDFSAAMQDT